MMTTTSSSAGPISRRDFNWDEDQYRNTWWHHFHHDIVDAYWNDNGKRITLFGTHRASIVGLLGLDLAHKDHHSELHPVYAMFVNVGSVSVSPTVTPICSGSRDAR